MKQFFSTRKSSEGCTYERALDNVDDEMETGLFSESNFGIFWKTSV
jgi:hypothetical protein